MDLVIEEICREVDASLTEKERQIVRRNRKEEGIGASYSIDGQTCISSVSFWPNGCCDIDYMYVADEQAKFNHHEFETKQKAIEIIIREIRAAVNRA